MGEKKRNQMYACVWPANIFRFPSKCPRTFFFHSFLLFFFFFVFQRSLAYGHATDNSRALVWRACAKKIRWNEWPNRFGCRLRKLGGIFKDSITKQQIVGQERLDSISYAFTTVTPAPPRLTWSITVWCSHL